MGTLAREGKQLKLKYVGEPIRRTEDLRLVSGKGVFIDDLPKPPNLHYAFIVRSPYAHARIKSIDVSEALKLNGVKDVITWERIKDLVDPFPHAIHSNVKYYPLATSKVRYVGEPVAVIVARDRFTAEDASSLIRIEYEQLPPVVDPMKALDRKAPLIHEELGSNIAWRRTFKFNDPEGAFSNAYRTFKTKVKINRFTTPPMEPYGIVASYDHSSEVLTEWCNFIGPFTFYHIVAKALRLTEDRFRVIVTKDNGGSFGTKTALFHYMALIGVTSMVTKVPIKWVETRTEHLTGSTRAAGRIAEFEVAVSREGRMTALRAKLIDDIGAYPRSPEPGHLLRQLGNFVGPYRIEHVEIDATYVLTNTVPTSPIRGFGGQHLYLPLEKLVNKASLGLNFDPIDFRIMNFINPNEFPYTTPTGGIYDSGDYAKVLKKLLELIDYKRLRQEIEEEQRKGKYIGLGIAVGVDPSVSNMGYLDVVSPPEERRKSSFLPKSGGQHTATVKVEPSGKVIVSIDSTPHGQAHETVIAQIVASVLGVKMEDVRVEAGVDTFRTAWSISTGTYSSRFASVGVSAVYSAAMEVREKILRIASVLLNVEPTELTIEDGKIYVVKEPSRSISLRRIAGLVHWNPNSLNVEGDVSLYSTKTFHIQTLTPPTLDDKTNSSGTYGFLADAALVEVDIETGKVRVLKYFSVHDAGTVINPKVVEQQTIGATNQGVEQVLYQELVYNEEGQPLTANFGDYFVMSAKESVEVVTENLPTPSPFTLLGSKGIGESNTETAPAAVVLAIEDALKRFGIEIEEVPVTPERLWKLIKEKAKLW